MCIILIDNQKGGVAKTTTAVNLAHGAALRGYKTLIIDLDPQGNVADSLGLPEGADLYHWLIDEEESFADRSIPSGRERLDVIRSNKRTANLKDILAGRAFREKVLETALCDHEDHYDLVFFDCPPSLDSLHIAALVASDLLIIPTKLDQFAVKGVLEVVHTLDTVKKNALSHCVLAGILPTFYDRVTNESQRQYEKLVEGYKGLVWPAIPVDNVCRIANRKGKTLFEMPNQPKARVAYADCLDRLVARI